MARTPHARLSRAFADKAEVLRSRAVEHREAAKEAGRAGDDLTAVEHRVAEIDLEAQAERLLELAGYQRELEAR